MEIVTRNEALTIHQKWFFTGIPCNHGHVAKRSTKNRVCFDCQKARSKNFRDNNTDYHHEYNKSYYPSNKERAAELSENYYTNMRKESPDVLMERQRAHSIHYVANNKELHSARGTQWRKANPGLMNTITARRRAKKLNATPSWSNHLKIQEIYLECEDINTINKMCGGIDKFVVDHIIPLQGKNVSGLHIANNLQIITSRENAIKSNKFNEEEF